MKSLLSKYGEWLITLALVLGIAFSHYKPSWLGTTIVIALVVSLATTYAKGISIQDRLLRHNKWLLISYGIAVLSMVPSIFVSTEIGHSIGRWFAVWLLNFLAFIAITIGIEHKKCVYLILGALGLYSIAENLYSLYQLLYLIPADWVPNMQRSYGFYGSPSRVLLYGTFLVMMIPTSLVIMLNKEFPNWLRCIYSFNFLTTFIGMGTNKSRSGWLINALSILGIGYLYRQYWSRFKYIVGAIIIALVVAFAMSPHYMDRLESSVNTTTDGSNLGRIYVWKSGINIAKEYPILGIGPGEFTKYYVDYDYINPLEEQKLPHTHNNFLQIFVESGIVGLLGFLVFIVSYGFSLVKQLVRRQNPYDLLSLTLLISYVVLVGCIDYSWWGGKDTSFFFWLLIGIMGILKYKIE